MLALSEYIYIHIYINIYSIRTFYIQSHVLRGTAMARSSISRPFLLVNLTSPTTDRVVALTSAHPARESVRERPPERGGDPSGGVCILQRTTTDVWRYGERGEETAPRCSARGSGMLPVAAFVRWIHRGDYVAVIRGARIP